MPDLKEDTSNSLSLQLIGDCLDTFAILFSVRLQREGHYEVPAGLDGFSPAESMLCDHSGLLSVQSVRHMAEIIRGRWR